MAVLSTKSGVTNSVSDDLRSPAPCEEEEVMESKGTADRDDEGFADVVVGSRKGR